MSEDVQHGGRRWVVNADDFGFSRGMTDGIVRAYREGILTSTTLMATMPDGERAVGVAGECEAVGGKTGLGVGVHLCLTQGKALTKCRTILDRDGAFPRGLGKLFLRLGVPGDRGKRARREALEEWCAQVEFAIGRGVKVTHLDSHKHIHHFPLLQEVVLEVARRYGIGHIRCAREVKVRGIGGGGAGYRVLGRLARRFAGKLKETQGTIETTDWFFGLATTGRTDDAVWEKLAAACPAGTGEVMVHPGYVDVTAKETRLLAGREVEMEALVSGRVREAVRRAGVRLVHYGEL